MPLKPELWFHTLPYYIARKPFFLIEVKRLRYIFVLWLSWSANKLK